MIGEPITVVIAREVPSQNRFQYSHWLAYTRERDAWLLMLRVHLRPRPHPPTRPVRATILSLRNRIIDYGNFVGGAKPIPDCLKRLGYIVDDSPRWWTCEYVQQRAPKALRCTRIHLQEVPA